MLDDRSCADEKQQDADDVRLQGQIIVLAHGIFFQRLKAGPALDVMHVSRQKWHELPSCKSATSPLSAAKPTYPRAIM